LQRCITSGIGIPATLMLMLELMKKLRRSLVVVENGTISGIIKRDDIIKEVAK
jgi:predicted transcriptional regulator